MGFLSPKRAAAPVAPPPQKPISPVTSRTTVEGTTRRQRRRSLATEGQGRSLLNDPVEPLG